MEDVLDVGSQLYENLFKIRLHRPVLSLSRVHASAAFFTDKQGTSV
jgi:hypothetical protein